MKEQFIEKKFQPESLRLLDVISSIVQRYQTQGLDLTVRQLYYQCVVVNLIPNNQQSYSRIQSLIGDARLAGLIDWDIISDRHRRTIARDVYPNLPAFLTAYVDHFAVDRWADQPYHIEVMVEKQALEGVLSPTCHKWFVPFTPNKGYSSLSMLYETGKRIQERIVRGKKKALVLYLGDFDPSGCDMGRDVQERLSLFARTNVELKRLALNPDQIAQYNPPENPAKMTDSRAAKFVEEHGDSSYELDALPPEVPGQLVEQEITKRLDMDRWHRAVAREEEQREVLHDMINTLK